MRSDLSMSMDIPIEARSVMSASAALERRVAFSLAVGENALSIMSSMYPSGFVRMPADESIGRVHAFSNTSLA